MKIEKESDLFEPIKKHFENLGFEVYGEIKDCDIAAVKEKTLIVVELKKRFSLKLIYQAMERKIITENVYIAIPRPKSFKDKNIKSMRRLLKELNIGLIIVSEADGDFAVQIISVPEPLGINKKNTKQNKVLKEIEGRKLNLNKGGINKTKILTAYKEKCILTACLLEIYKEITVAKLKKIPETADCCGALTFNYSGWFQKPRRGIYTLSEKGIEALSCEEYSQAVNFYREKAKEIYTREEKENV